MSQAEINRLESEVETNSKRLESSIDHLKNRIAARFEKFERTLAVVRHPREQLKSVVSQKSKWARSNPKVAILLSAGLVIGAILIGRLVLVRSRRRLVFSRVS